MARSSSRRRLRKTLKEVTEQQRAMRCWVLCLVLLCYAFPSLFQAQRMLGDMCANQKSSNPRDDSSSSSSSSFFSVTAEAGTLLVKSDSTHRDVDSSSIASVLPSRTAEEHDHPKLPYFVLTMKERRRRVEHVVEDSGLSRVNFVEGVRSTDLDIRSLEADGTIKRSSYIFPFPLSMGQVAVHLGHLRMLRVFEEHYEDDDIAVFLEDDIVPHDLFDEKIREIVRRAPVSWEIINLGRCRAVCNGNDETFSPKFEQCRTAYVVHRRGLSKLMNLSLPLEKNPGDKHWNALSISRAVEAYSVPTIATQSRNETGSYLRVVYDSLHECASEDPPLSHRTIAYVKAWAYRTISHIIWGAVM